MSMIRMMNDLTLSENEKKGYYSVIQTLKKIYKEEGLGSLWRGCQPAVLRGMVMNFTMLGMLYSRSCFINYLLNNDNNN